LVWPHRGRAGRRLTGRMAAGSGYGFPPCIGSLAINYTFYAVNREEITP